MTIQEQVMQKISELQNIMSLKGKGGDTQNKTLVGDEHKTITASNIRQEASNEKEQGGSAMGPISRGGEPVQDGKIYDPAMIAAMAGQQGSAVPQTDFLAMAKAADPYNESAAGIVQRAEKENAPETNTEINKELKTMPSTKEHAEALKVVEKPVQVKKEASVEEIANIVARVKALKLANDEIEQIVTEKPAPAQAPAKVDSSVIARIRARIMQRRAKVDGALVDPVKGSEDAAKTPEESVKSIKKGSEEMRPVESMGEGKMRYSPDKGNDIRDKEAKDAISKGDKDMGAAKKEVSMDRPMNSDNGKPKHYASVMAHKAALAGSLASLEVFADARGDMNVPVTKKYPIEKSPDQEFEAAAKRTESEIKSEHAERAKDKGEKSPLKTSLWSADKDTIKKQISAYQEALKEVKGESQEDLRKLEVLEAKVASLEAEMKKLSSVGVKTASWEGIIAKGNSVYARVKCILAAIDESVTPFIDEVNEVEKTGSVKFASEEDLEKFEKKEEKDEEKGEEKEEKAEGKDEKKDDKPGKDKKKKETKDVAKETVDLLESIRDTAREMAEDVEDHLKDVEKKTGIPAPKPGAGLPALPESPMGMEMGMLGEGLPGEGLPGEGMPGEEFPPMGPKLSWVGMVPKTAADEEQVVQLIMNDATITPEQKEGAVKLIRKTSSWKAVFTKIASAEGAADAAKAAAENAEKEKEKEGEKKEASVDKKNSFWSVYRGEELVARASVEDLYKDKAQEAFDWASSADYGRKLLGSILNDGLSVTAGKLGIESMVKISAKKGKTLDEKGYFKKVYPASYVSELFKDLKKKSEFQVSQLQQKVGGLEAEVKSLKQVNAELHENQVMHAKAEKALQLVTIAVEKGLVEQKDFDNMVDGVMLMDDSAFSTIASTVAKAPVYKKAATMDEKINMVKSASAKPAAPVTLDAPIQIVNDGAKAGGFTDLRAQLEGMWKRPSVQK